MSDEDTGATGYDQDGFTDEMSDSEFEAMMDDSSDNDDADSADQDIDESGDVDDSPTNLHASLALSAADRDDVGGIDDDVPEEVPQLTADQIELDQFRKERDSRTKTFAERCEDMDRPRSFGEIRAAKVWSRNQELERRANVAAASPDAEAANEARAVARAAAFFEAEDQDPGPGFISGPGSEHDADDAKRRFANAKDRWTDFCNDPNS